MAFEPSNQEIRHLPLQYDSTDPEGSARQLVLALRPDWASPDSSVVFVKFTDGITNTLLKAINEKADLTSDEIDRDAILLRAYGNGTDVIIDRQREAQNHELLMRHGLAPALLARFENGMLYRFIRGSPTKPEDLRRPDISAAIARRLAQWHAIVPCIPETAHNDTAKRRISTVSGKPEPNIWSVMQKWILALPTNSGPELERRDKLQGELVELVANLSQRPGLGHNGLVFSHNDLLSGNVIVLPAADGAKPTHGQVTFIDYEYAVPSPAAFDIANHFAEWGGFDCDMSVIPTVSQRRAFIGEYIRSYASFRQSSPGSTVEFDIDTEIANLLHEVDVFRGLPGFYWGIWASIQAMISTIDFDYASYAETRLSEYWAWKAETNGERAAAGTERTLREARWAQEDEEDNTTASTSLGTLTSTST
ncbi:ethanolamine kinase [Ophiostoma piceae UAMH 11346]|uniref:ethanolamine kinase n=1 Tax=Ophiostoma piceae (strain UAMH 11346) TaxID=1262450 RepID=S3BTV8_OPHP1|nr:ethanolamine kinase [Ophiostoma piceae UAMH 11346]